MQTMQQFVEKHAISVRVKRLADGKEHGAVMRRFNITLIRGDDNTEVRPVMDVPFFQGMAWTTEPTAAEVLNALPLDASGGNMLYAEWCSEYGYDADGGWSWTIFTRVQEITAKLRGFLTAEQFDELITDTETL